MTPNRPAGRRSGGGEDWGRNNRLGDRVRRPVRVRKRSRGGRSRSDGGSEGRSSYRARRRDRRGALMGFFLVPQRSGGRRGWGGGGGGGMGGRGDTVDD